MVCSLSMRLTVLLSLALLTSGVVQAHEAHQSRALDQSEETATAKAMRRVPEGATVTDISCREIRYVFQTRWRCTVTYSD